MVTGHSGLPAAFLNRGNRVTAGVSVSGVLADLVLVNGKVVTMDPKEAIREAVAVKFGRILAVGSSGEVEGLAMDSPVEEKEQNESAEAEVEIFVNAILVEAVKQNATDIHIEPFEEKSKLKFRIDSVMREITLPLPVPESKHNAIVSRIKSLAECNIAETRIPQDGRIRFTAEGKKYNARVSIVPALFGEAVVMRISDASVSLPSLAQLGFSERHLDLFENAIKQPFGLILITGPTGSGKITTLHAALNAINTPEVTVLTAENPIEQVLEDVVQVETKAEIGLGFAQILRAFLRHDPDIIMVGEIRDEETATIAVEAALTGHLVFSTLHTIDAATGITRLSEMGINEFLLASSVRLIQAQRLVRRVCSKCKKQVEPTDRMLKVMEECKVDTSNLQLYQGAGCDVCSGTGLKGMTAIHEILPVDDDIRKLILKGATSSDIRKAAREKGMRTLREDGMEKVAKGITTFQEVMVKTG